MSRKYSLVQRCSNWPPFTKAISARSPDSGRPFRCHPIGALHAIEVNERSQLTNRRCCALMQCQGTRVAQHRAGLINAVH